MTRAAATQARYTPEDLLAMPDGKSYELVDGNSWSGTWELNRVGWEAGYTHVSTGFARNTVWDGPCRPTTAFSVSLTNRPWSADPTSRSSDMAAYPAESRPRAGSRSRRPGRRVVSPNDRIDELEEKLEDYRKVSVPLIWVIYPESCTVMVYRNDGSVRLWAKPMSSQART